MRTKLFAYIGLSLLLLSFAQDSQAGGRLWKKEAKPHIKLQGKYKAVGDSTNLKGIVSKVLYLNDNNVIIETTFQNGKTLLENPKIVEVYYSSNTEFSFRLEGRNPLVIKIKDKKRKEYILEPLNNRVFSWFTIYKKIN